MCVCVCLCSCALLCCTCGSQCLISRIIHKSFSTCLCCWWWLLFLTWGLLLTPQLVSVASVPEQRAPVTCTSLFSSTRLTEHPAFTWTRESKLRSSRSCVKHIPTEHLPRPRWRTAGVIDYRTLVSTPSTKVLYHFPSMANGNTVAKTPQENPLNPSSNFVAT